MKHPNDTSWGNVASWYFTYLEDPNSYQARVIAPNLIRNLGIKTGEKILDLACGTGFFSELFHAQGAHVMGVDIGKELIDLAKQHASKDISFHVAPAHQLPFIASKSIDKLVIVLAIQNIKEVKEVFVECKRVLNKKGKLFIVLNHPAFRIPGSSSWEWEVKSNKQYRRVDQYLSEKGIDIAMHPGKNPSEKTVSFHRPLQFYVKHARGAGFSINRLEEWISHKQSEQGPRQKEEDRMRKEIPLFMMIELSV